MMIDTVNGEDNEIFHAFPLHHPNRRKCKSPFGLNLIEFQYYQLMFGVLRHARPLSCL